MRKCAIILFLSTFAMLSIYCSRDKSKSFIPNSDYDSISHSLKVDFLNDPEKSLKDIINLSKVRKSGYGLLLNMDSAYSVSELDALKRKFQKLDINAVHSFDISLEESLQNKIPIAMDGAKFIWILDKKNINLDSISLGKTISAIQNKKAANALIVITKN